MQCRGKHILVCGDWNINFLQCSVKLLELQNLLLMYSMVNTVKFPTRIRHNTCSLIDVMTTNLNLKKQTIIYDLGYSDCLAQIVYIKVDKPVLGRTAIKKRQFMGNAIEEFMYLLQEESWDEVLLLEDVNISFNAFLITFMYYFNTVFPFKTSYLNNNNKNK